MGSLEYKDDQGGGSGSGSGTGSEKPGDTGGSGDAGGTDGAGTDGAGSDGSLAQTGDASLFGAIAAGVSGLFAGGAGLFLHRRKRK